MGEWNLTDIITIVMNIIAIVTTIGTMLIVVWKLTKKIDNRLSILDDTNVRARRIEISQRINIDRNVGNDRETICKLYDEYKSTGANSYIDDIFKDYMVSIKHKMAKEAS